jgi:hypothetical protein
MQVDILTPTPHLIQFRISASNKEHSQHLCIGLILLVSMPIYAGILLNRRDVVAAPGLFTSISIVISVGIIFAIYLTLAATLKIFLNRTIQLGFHEKSIIEWKPMPRLRRIKAISISFVDIRDFTFRIKRKILLYDSTGVGNPSRELEGFCLILYGSFDQGVLGKKVWLELAEIPFKFTSSHVTIVEYIVQQFMQMLPDGRSNEKLGAKINQFKQAASQSRMRLSQRMVYPWELGPGDEANKTNI